MNYTKLFFLALVLFSFSTFAKDKTPAPALTAPEVCAGLDSLLIFNATEIRNKCNGEVRDGKYESGAVQICHDLPKADTTYRTAWGAKVSIAKKDSRTVWVMNCLHAIKNKTYTNESYKPCFASGDNDKIISCLANAADKPAPAQLLQAPASVP